MPRTQINYPKLPANLTISPGSEMPIPDPTLNVVWSKAPTGHVQVLMQLPRRYAEVVAASPDSEGPDLAGAYTPVLDRHEINHLIRSLRTARDQAYGRDE